MDLRKAKPTPLSPTIKPLAGGVGDAQGSVLPSVDARKQPATPTPGTPPPAKPQSKRYDSPPPPPLPVTHTQTFQVPKGIPELPLLRSVNSFSNVLQAEDNTVQPKLEVADMSTDLIVSGTSKQLRATCVILHRLAGFAHIVEGAPGFFSRRLKQATHQITVDIHAVAFAPCPKPRWVKFANAVAALIAERSKAEEEELKKALALAISALLPVCIKGDASVRHLVTFPLKKKNPLHPCCVVDLPTSMSHCLRAGTGGLGGAAEGGGGQGGA